MATKKYIPAGPEKYWRYYIKFMLNNCADQRILEISRKCVLKFYAPFAQTKNSCKITDYTQGDHSVFLQLLWQKWPSQARFPRRNSGRNPAPKIAYMTYICAIRRGWTAREGGNFEFSAKNMRRLRRQGVITRELYGFCLISQMKENILTRFRWIAGALRYGVMSNEKGRCSPDKPCGGRICFP